MASSPTLTQPTTQAPDEAPADTRAVRGGGWWRALARFEAEAALLLVVLVFGAIQTATPHIIGIDGQYHIKVAALIREQGPRIHFPWLRFTLLNESGYSDHHELLHLLQAPFTVLDLRIAAKLSAWVFAALGFWGCYLFMARSGVRWPLAWLTLLLAVSPAFLWRHSMTRAQSLSFLLLVAVAWAIFERRLRWLIPLGFAGAWLFDGSLLVLSVPLAALAAGLVSGERGSERAREREHLNPSPENGRGTAAQRQGEGVPSHSHALSLSRSLALSLSRPLAYLAAGVVLGTLLHPYFPNNAILTALHLLPKLGLVAQEDVSIGAEWASFSSTGFANRVGPSLLVLIVGMAPTLFRLWRKERPDFRALTLTLLAIFFLALVVRTQRIIEYFPGFAVLAAAANWSFSPLPRVPAVTAYVARWRPLLIGVAVAALALGLVASVRQARRSAISAPPAARQDVYRDGALWLAANSPPGSLVFNTDWDDFPQLFFWNTHNVYVVGLDPTRMSLYDLELYRLWRAIGSGAVSTPSRPLRERFEAAYVFTDTGHERFLNVAAEDPGLEEVFRSQRSVVFRVLPGP